MHCTHEGKNHSADSLTIWHGETTPLNFCGYHAQQYLNNKAEEKKEDLETPLEKKKAPMTFGAVMFTLALAVAAFALFGGILGGLIVIGLLMSIVSSTLRGNY